MQLFGMDILDVLLWASLMILIVAAILPKKNGYYAAAVGWVIFGVSWFLKAPGFFFDESNILYTVLCLLALPLTLYAAYILIRFQRESLMVVTRSVAISGLFYAPFAFIPMLNHWLIGFTADLTLACVQAIGYPATRLNFDTISLHGQEVQIILACTAIQSIAIFVGIVFCIRVETNRMLKAFLISVPLIYLLNLIRNTFVISAYGNQWLQIIPETVTEWTGKNVEYTSFFWAHNIIAEAGALIALVFISYVVLNTMPELLDYLQDVLNLLKIENIKSLLDGKDVTVITPTQIKSK